MIMTILENVAVNPVVSQLREWVENNKSIDNEKTLNIELDTKLIDEGVLDSLDMVNFVLYVEELRGEEIPETLIQPEYFVSFRSILDTFFPNSESTSPNE